MCLFAEKNANIKQYKLVVQLLLFNYCAILRNFQRIIAHNQLPFGLGESANLKRILDGIDIMYLQLMRQWSEYLQLNSNIYAD